MNKIIITGRMTKNPELEITKNGHKMVQFTVAVYDGLTEEGEKKTQFIYCRAFGSAAESIARYTTKGDFISVGGKLQIDSYEKDGETRYSAFVLVGDLDLIPTAKKEEAEPPKKYSKRR